MIQVIKKHKGLGDTVEFILDKTGLSYAVKSAASSVGITDCGCEERKEKLNKLIPYGRTREDSEVL